MYADFGADGVPIQGRQDGEGERWRGLDGHHDAVSGPRPTIITGECVVEVHFKGMEGVDTGQLL